ncbi:NAD(P)H-dependent flavin oxidoreductase [Mycobacterium sp. Lab-001]|uniref:NAD(P)H-dependent flavin oxidoreductase n=1 Tax=Mycobacterium sp. Lab-001 TaxID=3410136 RepID=UPI003D164A9A
MPLRTRLTRLFDIEHPILLAPMARVSGGRLAAAVTGAGGLGMVGGGYGESDWLRTEICQTGAARVGYGFITWSLADDPEVLDMALETQPATIMLSFGDPMPFAARIRAAGVSLTAQVQDLEQARRALDIGADVLVAQGGEAGGHGKNVRSTFTLVPDVVDLAAERSPATPVVAAGGVADGRGLAAALALGADGALVGTRFWAANEALVSPRAHRRGMAASGDETIRTRVYDIVRQKDWPAGYDLRLVSNAFVEAWHGNEAQLLERLPEMVSTFQKALETEDFDVVTVLVGETIGRIDAVRPAAAIVGEMAHDAARILNLAAPSPQ